MGTAMGSGIGCGTHQIGGTTGSQEHAPMERWGGAAQCNQGLDVQRRGAQIHTFGNSSGTAPLLFEFLTTSCGRCALPRAIQ